MLHKLYHFWFEKTSQIHDEHAGQPRVGDFTTTAMSGPLDLVLAIDALGVDPEEGIHAVPGPLGGLGRRDPGIQPSRNGCVA